MGQAVGKRSLIPKPVSIYDTSVWARKYRHDFEALQLSEDQVRLVWDEYCKVSMRVAVVRSMEKNTGGRVTLFLRNACVTEYETWSTYALCTGEDNIVEGLNWTAAIESFQKNCRKSSDLRAGA